MATAEKVSIELTSEMAAAVREAVEKGEYASSSEVVREALRDWKLKRSLHQKEIEELRRIWQIGLDSGSGRFADMQEIKTQARRLHEKARRPR